MQTKFGLVISFFFSAFCFPFLIIGFTDATQADTTYQKTDCEEGGTHCPRVIEDSYCPSPLSDSNYFCSLDPQPTTCNGVSLGSCIDMTPAAANPTYPCGYEKGCLSENLILSNNEAVHCTQVHSFCSAGS